MTTYGHIIVYYMPQIWHTTYAVKGGLLLSEYKTLFEKLAQDRNISVEEMRSIIAARIETGINDPDPIRRTQWEKIPHIGDVPTPEEWLRYVVEKLEDEGLSDLLRWYPNL